jgi:hypothetical protein
MKIIELGEPNEEGIILYGDTLNDNIYLNSYRKDRLRRR